MPTDPLSEAICKLDPEAVLKRLHKAGYVSPQGVPFSCRTCSFFSEPTVGTNALMGFCSNKDIQGYVEKEGCCNYWTSQQGVHG